MAHRVLNHNVSPRVLNHILAVSPGYGSRHKQPPEGGRSLVEVAGIEPASKKRDMEGRYRLGPNPVTSAGGRTTLIEDLSPGLGCRQGTSRQPILTHCPADRSHPFSGLTSPVPGASGDSPLYCLRSESEVARGAVETAHIVGFFVFIGLMRGPADKPPPAPHIPTATCRNQSPPVCGTDPPSPRGARNGSSGSVWDARRKATSG